MKNYNFTLYIIELLLIVTANSCFYDKVYYVMVKNNSNSTIAGYIAEGYNKIAYPDTMLSTVVEKGAKTMIKPGTIFGIQTGPTQRIFEDLPSDTLSIYIFSQDTLDTYGWEEIRDGYKILRRYDLSYPDLEKLKFVIPYPPSEAMKGMKMYPPF